MALKVNFNYSVRSYCSDRAGLAVFLLLLVLLSKPKCLLAPEQYWLAVDQATVEDSKRTPPTIHTTCNFLRIISILIVFCDSGTFDIYWLITVQKIFFVSKRPWGWIHNTVRERVSDKSLSWGRALGSSSSLTNNHLEGTKVEIQVTLVPFFSPFTPKPCSSNMWASLWHQPVDCRSAFALHIT